MKSAMDSFHSELKTKDDNNFWENVFNKQSEPIIGLKYIVIVAECSTLEPSYNCLMCDKKCDTKNIINHLTSNPHRLKYLVRNI